MHFMQTKCVDSSFCAAHLLLLLPQLAHHIREQGQGGQQGAHTQTTGVIACNDEADA